MGGNAAVDEEKVKLLKEYVQECGSIVFFGGAGVSTESGIPDFRSTDGLYHQEWRYPPETILSHSFFVSHTEEFFRFYRKKMLCLDAEPNAAHRKLAQLEQQGKLSAVVTQNIDGLHQAAGSQCVYELHGSVHRNYCQRCGAFYDARYILESEGIPRCSCGGVIKADMLIIGGTSLAVYPAAGLIDYFSGRHLVLINRDATPRDREADLLIQGNIGEVLSGI